MGIFSIFRQIRGYSNNPQSKTRISFLRLWGEHWLENQNANRSNAFKKLRKPQYTDGSNLYSDTNKVTVFYTIDGYPTSIAKDFRKSIRDCITGYTRVRVSFIDNYEETTIDWESPQVKAKLRNWQTTADEEEGQTNAYNIQEKVVGNKNRSHREASLEYLATALQTRQRHLFRVRSMLVVTGERGTMFDHALHAVEEYCQQIGLSITRVTDNFENYMRVYSPFSLTYSSAINREVGNPTMTDEILAQTYSYTQGKVGDTGKYWGMDVESGFPVFKEIKQDPKDPENILITGQTGSGKSFFAKSMILQLLCDNRFFGTIMDYEGSEYQPLVAYVQSGEVDQSKIVTLNMGAGTGKYFDPVPICNINVMGANRQAFTEENNPYEMAKSYTSSLISVLSCRDRAPTQYEEGIINDAIVAMYRSAGVTENPYTWNRSNVLTIHSVFKQIDLLYKTFQGYVRKRKLGLQLTQEEDVKSSPEYAKAIQSVWFNLNQYLSPNAQNKTMFSKPIRLEEIISAKLVVCSFGMLGRGADTIPPIELAMMSQSAAVISHIRSLYSKAQGKLNFKIWEEFQRWSTMPGSVKTIKVALTGGRKLGDVNIIITNDIKSILLKDDFALIDNLTTTAIGLIGDNETRNLIIKKWPELEPMRESLDRIASVVDEDTSRKKQKDLTESKYDKAFLVFLDRKVSTVSKMYLPTGLATSDIFKTAVEIAEEQKESDEGYY